MITVLAPLPGGFLFEERGRKFVSQRELGDQAAIVQAYRFSNGFVRATLIESSEDVIAFNFQRLGGHSRFFKMRANGGIGNEIVQSIKSSPIKTTTRRTGCKSCGAKVH